MKILVVSPGPCSRVVLALPVYAALAAAHPDSEIHALVDEATVPLVESDPHLQAIQALDGGGDIELRRRLADERYDAAVLLEYRRSLASLLARAGIRRRIGPLEHWSGLLHLNRWVRGRNRASHEHLGDALLRRARAVGGRAPVKSPSAEAVLPRIHLSTGQLEIGREFRRRAAAGAGAERTVFIQPGDGYDRLHWSSQDFLRLANTLGVRPGVRVFVVGGRRERETVGEMAGSLHSGVRVLQESHDLRELLGVLATADLFVGGPDGLLPAVAALGRPTLALWPPLPGRTFATDGPRDGNARALAPDVLCPARRICFFGNCRRWNCMEELAGDTVARAAVEILAAGPGREYAPVADDDSTKEIAP